MTTPSPARPSTAAMTAEALAAQPPWDVATLLALPGQTRGVQLQNWAAQIGRRFGSAAVRDLRDTLGAPLAAVGDAPERAVWVPLGLPLALHQSLVTQQLGGDWRALQGPMREDALAQVPTLARWSLRAAGITRLLERVPSLHGWLYDCGAAEIQAEADGAAPQAALRIVGGGLFRSPHWCLEQLFALETLGEICGLQMTGFVENSPEDQATPATTLHIRCHRPG